MADEQKSNKPSFWLFFKRSDQTAPEASLNKQTTEMDPAEQPFSYRADGSDAPLHQIYYDESLQPQQPFKMASDKLGFGRIVLQTYADIRNVLLASIVPLGICAFNMIAIGRDPQAHQIFETLPPGIHKLVPSPAKYGVHNVFGTLPLGYASYIVWKFGQGQARTQALGVYSFTLLSMLGMVPAFKSGSRKWVTSASLLLAAAAGLTSFAFYKVDQRAGLWAIPLVVCTSLQALPLLSCSLCPACKPSDTDSVTVTTARSAPSAPKTAVVVTKTKAEPESPPTGVERTPPTLKASEEDYAVVDH